jgi:hypothetical protein
MWKKNKKKLKAPYGGRSIPYSLKADIYSTFVKRLSLL